MSSVLKAAQLAGQQHRKRVTTATLNIVVRYAQAVLPASHTAWGKEENKHTERNHRPGSGQKLGTTVLD